MILHQPFYTCTRSSPSHHLHFRHRQVVIPSQLHPHIPPAPPDSYPSQQPCLTRCVIVRHPSLIDRRRQVSRTERIVRDQHVEVAQSVTATIGPIPQLHRSNLLHTPQVDLPPGLVLGICVAH